MNYQFCCVSPDNYELLEEISDNMQDISGATFFKMVELEELRNSLMYGLGDYFTSKIKVLKDYSNRFYKSKANNTIYYIFQNSAIEYIFN